MKKLSMKETTTEKLKLSPPGAKEGAPRATGLAPGGGGRENDTITAPDPEVPAHKRRRKLTQQYKLRILKEADQCTEPGQIGALLRREGLYSSSLTLWRRQRTQGILSAMAPKKRGRKQNEKNPLTNEVAKLQKENKRLRKELWKAERVIEVQKKISEILGISQEIAENERNSS
jgi:transposase-like protein